MLLFAPKRLSLGIALGARLGGCGDGRDLALFFGLEFLGSPIAALIVSAGGSCEEGALGLGD